MSEGALDRARQVLGEELVVERTRRGEQADVLEVRAGDSRFVLKAFSSRHPSGAAGAAEAEADALARLGTSPAPPGVRIPTLLARFPEERAYLMTHEPGVAIDGRVPDDIGRVAELLVDALTWYHDTTGDIVGDFQPANVLVDGASIVLLDPTAPSPIFRDVAERVEDRLAADVGYWVFTVAARTAKRALLAPGTARAHVRLASELVAAATRRGGASTLERVRDAARAHRRWLARSQPLKAPVAALAAVVARSILSRAT